MVDIGGGGDVEVSPEPRVKKKPRGAPRAPQQCITCGHRRQQDKYSGAHPPPLERGQHPSCNQ